jgi:hypothetical protein
VQAGLIGIEFSCELAETMLPDQFVNKKAASILNKTQAHENILIHLRPDLCSATVNSPFFF